MPGAHQVAGELDAIGGFELPLLAVEGAVVAKLLGEEVRTLPGRKQDSNSSVWGMASISFLRTWVSRLMISRVKAAGVTWRRSLVSPSSRWNSPEAVRTSGLDDLAGDGEQAFD